MEYCDECGDPFEEDVDGASERHCGVCTRQLRAEEDYDERIRNQWQG
jgi:hypothetical protein